MFSVSERDGETFACAVDDCKVSIMSGSGDGDFQLRYAFSTDKPTVCVKFSPRGDYVFVVTDRVYKISMADYQVAIVRKPEEIQTLPIFPVIRSKTFSLTLWPSCRPAGITC